MYVCYTTDISLALKKKKGKESQYKYLVSQPETGSDSPIGSDRELGRDISGLTRLVGPNRIRRR